MYVDVKNTCLAHFLKYLFLNDKQTWETPMKENQKVHAKRRAKQTGDSENCLEIP